MGMGRPKKNDYPPYMTLDRQRNRFVVTNPLTGKKKRFEDEREARETAALLAEYVEKERQSRLLDDGRPKIVGLVDSWERDKLQFMPWDEGTRRNVLAKMRRIRKELGSRTVAHTDRLFLEEWLSGFCKTGDQFNKWRYALILLWRYAVAKKYAEACEPELIEKRSTSKKLAMNRKVRRQLDVAGFWAIHEHAEPWLQIAMEQSLVTLQARAEICNMQHQHYRRGYLFVIRDKVSGDSDMAFIKIKVTDELEDIRRRSLSDRVVSPFLVHRAPERRRRQWTEGKPHWTYVNPEYLSKAFAEARDKVERYAELPPRERPTFHEIRGLGARLYRKLGVPEAAIQALMTHANKRTTAIYLDRGAEALSDDDYITVSATLRLADTRKGV